MTARFLAIHDDDAARRFRVAGWRRWAMHEARRIWEAARNAPLNRTSRTWQLAGMPLPPAITAALERSHERGSSYEDEVEGAFSEVDEGLDFKPARHIVALRNGHRQKVPGWVWQTRDVPHTYAFQTRGGGALVVARRMRSGAAYQDRWASERARIRVPDDAVIAEIAKLGNHKGTAEMARAALGLRVARIAARPDVDIDLADFELADAEELDGRHADKLTELEASPDERIRAIVSRAPRSG